MPPYHPLGIAQLEEYNKYSSAELFIPGERECDILHEPQQWSILFYFFKPELGTTHLNPPPNLIKWWSYFMTGFPIIKAIFMKGAIPI